ncbi:MAG: TRAP transporter substrate-binding protein DctP [Clostridiales Family XIII bacterium]|nr:TRAP transporter substrate-binding protein DctP [Clostridiales Family XIII bacterium]
MKKTLKKILLISLSAIIVLSFTACGNGATSSGGASGGTASSAAADDTIYKLTYASGNGPENGVYQDIESVLLQKIREKSNGRIEIEEHIGGTLFKSGDAFEGARQGAVDISFDMVGLYAGQFPVTTLLEQSCAGPATANAACALVNEFKDTYTADLPEYDGVVPLIMMNAGPACLFGNKPIRTVGDIRGQQIRTNATNSVVIEKLGGTPVIIGMNEVYDAFSTNMIDSGWFVPEAMYGFSLYEVSNYATVWPYNQSIVIFTMNEDKFNSLPADLQQVIKDAAAEVFDTIVMGYYDSTFNTFLDMAKEKNSKFEVINLPQSDLDAITESLWVLVEEYAESIEASGNNGLEMMAWMQERAAYYNEQFS